MVTTGGGNVAIANVNPSGIGSWEIVVLERPYGSTTPLGTLASANSATPAGSVTPDVSGGCWRIQLNVWSGANRTGTPNTDIRNFGALGANGKLAPPPMIWPEPLPDPRSGRAGAKPNEMNFGGQDDGWAGSGNDGLLRHLIRTLTSGGDVVGPAGAVNLRIAVFDLTTGKLIKDGGSTIAEVLAAAAAASEGPQGSVALTFGASGNVDGTAFTVPASPTGAGRFVLSRVVVRLATALTGSGSVAVTVGTTAGGQQFITSLTVNNASVVGVLAGLNIATLGASMLAVQGYEAVLDPGATVVVRCATTGTVSAGGIKVYVFGYYLP